MLGSVSQSNLLKAFYILEQEPWVLFFYFTLKMLFKQIIVWINPYLWRCF